MPFTLRNLKENLEDLGSRLVLRASGRMSLDDEIVELKEWDAVRGRPGMWRGYEAGPEGLEIFVIGAPDRGESPRDDVDGRRDWCADSRPSAIATLPADARSLRESPCPLAWGRERRGIGTTRLGCGLLAPSSLGGVFLTVRPGPR